MAITFSDLRKPTSAQVVDPSTGRMTEEWQLYFEGLTKRLNGAVGELAVDPAPADAQYIVGAASSGLSAERVATNSTSNTWNLATPGQAAVERAALTGDVTASANSNATTIADDAVTNAKAANMAQSTIKGRAVGAGTGDPTDLTATQATAILNPFTSALQGLVPASGGGTTTFLRADATFAAPPAATTLATEQATTSGTSFDFTGIGASAKRIQIIFNEVSLDGTNELLVQIGDSGGLETTGYVSTGEIANVRVSSTSGFIMRAADAARVVSGIMTLVRVNSLTWIGSYASKVSATATSYGGGSKTLSATLDRVRILASGANNFDAGSVNVLWE